MVRPGNPTPSHQRSFLNPLEKLKRFQIALVFPFGLFWVVNSVVDLEVPEGSHGDTPKV
jgi:hypothetical protein